MNVHAYLKGCKFGHYLGSLSERIHHSIAALRYSERDLKRFLREAREDLQRDLVIIWTEE